jgi:hypothetical protein
MSIFNTLSTEGLEQAQDRIGGFSPLDSDIYTMTIKALYVGKSAGGAMSLTLLADNGGREYRETLWITNKKGENFFLNANDKTKKVPLPGFTVADDICLITTGKSLSEQDAEEKVINVYDYEAKKEVPKSVQMITEVIGQKVSLGIIKQTVNKNEKVGDEYVPTAETRDENFIDKVFHPDQKMTVVEARNGVEEAKFWDSWVERNKGNTRDKRTIKDGEANSGRPPKAAPTAGAAPAARKSLFGNK